MHVTREAVAGVSSGLAFFTAVLLFGSQSPDPTVRAFSWLVGMSGGSAVGVFAALATHLARGPAGYQPLEGESSAWGLAEFDETTNRR